MIVKRIEIERFGTLDHIVIDDLDRGVEVLHGTNETGKTTLLEFVRGVFLDFQNSCAVGISMRKSFPAEV